MVGQDLGHKSNLNTPTLKGGDPSISIPIINWSPGFRLQALCMKLNAATEPSLMSMGMFGSLDEQVSATCEAFFGLCEASRLRKLIILTKLKTTIFLSLKAFNFSQLTFEN